MNRPTDSDFTAAASADDLEPAPGGAPVSPTEEETEDRPEVPESFSVRDEATANWLVRKIVEARDYADRVTTWAEREKRRAQHEEAFFLKVYGRQLEEWAAGRIAQLKGRRKSLNLPAGTVGFRHENAKLVLDDEPAVLGWARQHCPEAVATIERLSKSALNQHLERTGELPEGAHLEDARDKFYVK